MFKKLPIDASKLTIFFFIAMLTLISGILRTIPVGAYSKNFTNIPDEVPRLNSEIIEKKFLNDFLLFKKKNDYKELQSEFASSIFILLTL